MCRKERVSVKLQTYMCASEWIRTGWWAGEASTECQQLQLIIRGCRKPCVEMASGALSDISSKECVDRLVMSVIGAGTGNGMMHAIYLSFLERERYSFWKDQIKYQPWNTYYAVGARLLAFIVISINVHQRTPPHFTDENTRTSER